jgi:hypothetical protein
LQDDGYNDAIDCHGFAENDAAGEQAIRHLQLEERKLRVKMFEPDQVLGSNTGYSN